MKKLIQLPLKAFSINKASGRDARFKTQAYKDWSYQVFHYLSKDKNKQILRELRDHFNPKIHAYIIELTTFYPEEVLITKNGLLSARAFDTTNVEKPLIDLIFSPSHFKKPPPYGCENLNIDDKYLLDMMSKKRIDDSFSLLIEISIIEKDKLLKSHILNDKN